MKKILIFILVFLVIVLGVLVYSRFLGIRGLKTNEIVIHDNIPDSYDGLKIVHFADIHYKKVINESKVKKVVKEINSLEPDVVVFSGDLVDDDYELNNGDINFLIKEFSSIDSKYGSYAVMGDQDMHNKETVRNIYIQSGFVLLENEATVIKNENNDKILLGGVLSSVSRKADIRKTMETVKENVSYKIILTHEPDYVDSILEYYSDVSLVLSSHSINGSINIPIVKRFLLPKGAYAYFKPYYKINNTSLYISNGIEVNDINFRFFNTPSINFYRLKKK